MKKNLSLKEKKLRTIVSGIVFVIVVIAHRHEIANTIKLWLDEEYNYGITSEEKYSKEEYQTNKVSVNEEPLTQAPEQVEPLATLSSEKPSNKLILKHGRWAKGEGIIIKVLPDDTNPPCHQRLLLKFSDDRTLLITHNVELAPRVENPQRGDLISFYGEFIDNEKGGLIHWTHHDPNGGRGGYLIHNSIRYE